LVIWEVPQLNGSMLHVVLEEVTLQTHVFSLLANQGIMGLRDGALVVLLYGGGFGDGRIEDLPHKLAEVESLLGGVSRRVVLGFTSGLGHTSLLFGLVADGPASESEEIARTGLAGRLPIHRRQSQEVGDCGPCPPQSQAHVDGTMEVSKDLLRACRCASVGDA
jgi:hypothetical protein